MIRRGEIVMAKIVTSIEDIGRVRYVLYTIALPTSEGEEAEEYTYRVRGLTPKEDFVLSNLIATLVEPRAPTKQRVAESPGGKLDASNMRMEEYQDENDPTYQEELRLYDYETRLMMQRALMYRLMCGVVGFNLTDEQIKEKLGVEAAPKEPVQELTKRLDQLSEIILPDFDTGHYMRLTNKVRELSGVSFDQVNFT
jgi:hypothetical protein